MQSVNEGRHHGHWFALLGAIPLACALAPPAVASHTARGLAGNWRTAFEDSDPPSGTISFRHVSVEEGLAALANIGDPDFCPTSATDYYVGEYTRGSDHGIHAGCTGGGIVVPLSSAYRSDSNPQLGGFVIQIVDGDSFSGAYSFPGGNSFFGFTGSFTGHFPGDGSDEPGGSCPAPLAASGIRPRAVAEAPRITSFVVPTKANIGEPTTITVGFTDPDDDVVSLLLEEDGGDGFEPVGEGESPVPPQRFGTVLVDITCVEYRTSFIRAQVVDDACNRSAFSGALTYECVCPRGKEPGAWYNNCTKKTLNQLNGATNIAAGSAAIAGAFPGPQQVPILVTSGALWIGSGVLTLLTTDPPDPNFTVIAEPTPPPLPPLPDDSGASPELLTALTAYLTNVANTIGVERALLASGERFQGAAAAGDAVWETTQLDKVAEFSAQLAGLLAAQPALAEAVQAQWLASGFPDVFVTPEDFAAFQADVAATGLPAELVDTMTQLGADAATLEATRTSLLALDPAAQPGSFLAALIDPGLSAATTELGTELGRVVGPSDAFPPCASSAECDDGDPCTTDTCVEELCTVVPTTGPPAQLCAFDRSLDVAACQGQSVPRGVGKKFLKARGKAERSANASTPAKAAKLLKQARATLAGALKLVAKAEKRKKAPLSDACASALGGLIGDAQTGIGG